MEENKCFIGQTSQKGYTVSKNYYEINKDQLTAVINSIQQEKKDEYVLSIFDSKPIPIPKNSWYFSSSFFDFIGLYLNQKNSNSECHKKTLSAITFDTWNISTLLFRLLWMKQDYNNIKIIRDLWGWYIKLDVEHFHNETKAILDYLAQIIFDEFSLKKSKDDVAAIGKLIGKDKKNYLGNLPDDLKTILEDIECFNDFNVFRAEIQHHGQEIFVEPNIEKGILFNFIFNKERLNHLPCIFFVDARINFELYAAFYMLKILLFLENFGVFLKKHYNFGTDLTTKNPLYAPGFYTIKYLLAQLEQKLK